MAQATAKLHYLNMAPRKVRLVADVIRGLGVIEAEAQLALHARRAAQPLLKLLRSAIANAKMQKLDAAKLIVSRITVDQGPMLKRSLPRAQGRATPLQKKMSHVALVLEESARVAAPRFVLRVEKKAKKEKPVKEKRALKSAAPNPTPVKEKSGFFKRIFNRKSI
ncbi:MAG: 50S ribosomal protein L22 [Candidatus Harrisonbacteria bacterium]|nr:50S ribosomal protein L22 [Candidatus Harrisonbacteria bacterium]MBI2604131.1 50S ribosomal protein L22 [Candidatus Harrisonbacteria bacterium]